MRLSCYTIYKQAVDSGTEDDMLFIRSELFIIRRSILRLPESREKLYLYQRYINGETMERCAELLDISRRSVFRLRISALELYIKHNPDGEAVRVLE